MRAFVTLVQKAIALEQPLRADGHYGVVSAHAKTLLRDPLNRFVDDMAEELNLDLPRFVSLAEIEKGIASVSLETGVPISFLRTTIDLENYRAPGGYLVEFEGRHQGLGQFNSTTWDSVSDAPFAAVSESIVSIMAIAQLHQKNQESFLISFPGAVFIDEIAYLYHNQGAPSAAHYLRSGEVKFPKQSNNALSVFSLARDYHEEITKYSTI